MLKILHFLWTCHSLWLTSNLAYHDIKKLYVLRVLSFKCSGKSDILINLWHFLFLIYSPGNVWKVYIRWIQGHEEFLTQLGNVLITMIIKWQLFTPFCSSIPKISIGYWFSQTIPFVAKHLIKYFFVHFFSSLSTLKNTSVIRDANPNCCSSGIWDIFQESGDIFRNTKYFTNKML